MERSLADDGKTLAEQSPADLDRRWQVVKSREGSAGG
jgi:hypothetical protein